MTTWKLTVEYDGSRYSGWQEQKNARTVEGELRSAIQLLLGVVVQMQGSGRTDAGVHALCQVAHVRVPGRPRVDERALLRELNERLPTDIVVLSIEPAAPEFHARHNASARVYLYRISTRKNAFAKRHVWWVKQALDVAAMAQAARLVAGRHDFRNFHAPDPARPDESTIVVVEKAEIECLGGEIRFRIQASHFIWKMVRRVVGALVKVGLGELPPADFARLIDEPAKFTLPVAEWTAPASGLFLEEVRYPERGPAPRKAPRGHVRVAFGGRAGSRLTRPRHGE